MFQEELARRVSSGKMAPSSLPRLAARKNLPDFTAQAFKWSLGLHLGLLVTVWTAQWAVKMGWIEPFVSRPPMTLTSKEMKSAIRVDVVDLPNMKVSDFQELDLTKDVDPKLKQQQAPEEKIESKKIKDSEPREEAMTPSEKAMVLKKDTATKDQKKSDDEKSLKPTAKEAAAAKRLKALQDKLRTDARRKELMAKLKDEASSKEENYRPAVAGNMLSEGYSLTGDVAKDIDVYAGKVKAHLAKNWTLAGWLQSANLKAQVLVKVAPDGRFVSKEFLKRSGNVEFDAAVELTLKRSEPFPVPPPPLKRKLTEEGILCGFPD